MVEAGTDIQHIPYFTCRDSHFSNSRLIACTTIPAVFREWNCEAGLGEEGEDVKGGAGGGCQGGRRGRMSRRERVGRMSRREVWLTEVRVQGEVE